MVSVTKRIIAYNKKRNPLFLQIKYNALAESPFRFFRGTCHLFYEDLAKIIPVKDPTKAWICGDLHLENFGTFKGNNGLVYFDLNDFDEAILAPATWEILRALTSIFLATDSLQKKNSWSERLATCFIDAYINNMITGKPLVFERATTRGLIETFIAAVSKRKSQEILEGRLVFKGSEASLKIIKGSTVALKDSQKKKVLISMKAWCKKNNHLHWKARDAAYRIAGTGSLGVTRFIILMYDKTAKCYFLLDLKEALPSSLQPFVTIKQPPWKSEAERVVTIQEYAQNVAPALLGTADHTKNSFVIKRLQPTQDRMSLTLCKGKIDKLEEIINTFAEISASAQLRSTGRSGSSTTDELIAFFKTTPASLKEHLLNYSKKYAAKVKVDYADYCKVYKQIRNMT